MSRHEDIRRHALEDLQRFEVLMIDGHFDYGNGYHGRVYSTRTSCSATRPRSGDSRRT